LFFNYFSSCILGILALLFCLAPAALQAKSRSLLYREINLSAIYSRRGENLDFHPSAPLTSVGFEYLWKSSDSVSGQLRAEALDLYMQFVYDPLDDRFETRFQDAWVRFGEPESGLKVRLGHFILPFGLNPLAQPRGEILLPLMGFDLGPKRDWGLSMQSRMGNYSFESAATLGTQDKLRRQRGRYLLTSRLGLPAFHSLQYGVSYLYGNAIKPGRSLQNIWRFALDMIYMYNKPFAGLRAEFTLGANDSDPVHGFLVGLSHIFPQWPHYAVEAQVRTWREDILPQVNTRAETTIGIWHSLPGMLTMRVHWRHPFSTAAFHSDDIIYTQLYYYGY
jgi:hypothetical protein